MDRKRQFKIKGKEVRRLEEIVGERGVGEDYESEVVFGEGVECAERVEGFGEDD